MTVYGFDAAESPTAVGCRNVRGVRKAHLFGDQRLVGGFRWMKAAEVSD